MTTSTPSHTGPTLENEVEQAVVEHLVERVRTRLTDRGGARHAPPWEAKQEVRIGRLRPSIEYGPPEDDGDEETSEQEAATEDTDSEDTRPSWDDLDVLGLDFTATPSSNGDSLTVVIDVDLAVYLPENPTLAEATRHFQQQQEQEESQTNNEDEAATPAGSGVGHGQQVPLQRAWRRHDIHVEDLELVIPSTGDHVTDNGQIAAAVSEAVQQHFASDAAARPFDGPRVVPVSHLKEGAYEEALAARRDSSWSPNTEGFEPELTAFAEVMPNGKLLVSLSLTNAKQFQGKPFLDLTLYDCRFTAEVRDGQLHEQRFQLAPEDYRFRGRDTVPGHGRSCVAVEEGPNRLRTETLPIHRQAKVVPRTGHVPQPEWSELAQDPTPVLEGVLGGMRRERDEWEAWLVDDVADPDVQQAARRELQDFEAELERFELGMSALHADPRLKQAFQLANQAFANQYAVKPHIHSWRLFQFVYIVTHLPALVARERRNDTKFTDELDYVDVLWFPTGGGKTEAYLGLIVTAALYDRLRGKDRGVTAWLKFPLRMLSVQQLVRVLQILVEADKLREQEGIGGDPFELGYLVGGSNTPNQLRYANKWWPGFDAAAKQSGGELDPHRLVGQCPFCGDKHSIGLDVDEDTYRLKHVCRNCDRVLPIYMSDEEVYRYQPTVLVSTVDKITGFAHFGEFTSFTHGPELACPDHGYMTFGNCSAGDRCDHDRRTYKQVTDWKDPVPALMIQDEMHLIREELGAFDAHFEGLLAELQRSGPSELPSKILAATATIEQFQDQLRQVYGRKPRRFPSPGFRHDRSFYSTETPDSRRLFLGVMPTGGGISKVEVGAVVQRELVTAVHDLQNDLTAARGVISHLPTNPSDAELERLLFMYEVSLAFVNSKAHGAMIRDELGELNYQLAAAGQDEVRHRVLTSEVPIAELAEVIDLVEDTPLSHPRSERLRAMIGTSVVSHGVDLERLNAMTMVGLPPTTADYIQATSRSGRTHVGLVVTVLDHFSKRESSTFANFTSTHEFLDRLVEPVPVNKYAKNAVSRTLPALAVALLWDLARDPHFAGPTRGIKRTRDFKPWWNAEAANGLDGRLVDRIKASYRSPVSGVNPRPLEDRLVDDAATRWTTLEKMRMQQFNADNLKQLFAEKVLTSLRDIDEPAEFSGMWNSTRLYEAMFDRVSHD